MAGARVNVPAQVKPLIDKKVADQIAAVQARMRNDPTLRTECAGAMGQGLPLDPAAGHRRDGSSMPALWLELRPPARSPRSRASMLPAVTLTLGIEAETRITPVETKPDCPFPATIVIVPPTPGRVVDRRAHRHALHRDQQDRRGAVRRKDLSGGRLGLGRRHREARQRRGIRRPPADFAAGERQGEEELLRLRRRGQCAYLGAGPCSIRPSRRCG